MFGARSKLDKGIDAFEKGEFGRVGECHRHAGIPECIQRSAVQRRLKILVAGKQVQGPGERVCGRILAREKQCNDVRVHVLLAEAGFGLVDKRKHRLEKIAMGSAVRAAHRVPRLGDHLLGECANRLQ